ncbi:MAG: tellurite resistance TerB family protein [Beijerinckiaceae bacterium]
MFDAKSVLGALLGGGQQPRAGGTGAGGGDLGSLLGGLLNQGQSGGSNAGGGGLGGALGGLLNQVTQGGAQRGQPAAPTQGGGGLSDLLGQLTQGGAGAQAGAGGGLGGLLGGILSQATGGVRDAANHAGAAAGNPNAVNDILAKLGGGQGGDIVGKIRALIENNPGMASAGLGGLASIVLGTGAGRSVASTAAKIGALALIGGLAYSAWLNVQEGRPPISAGEQPQLAAAPAGSGFEPEVATNDTAILFIRAMISAAAADGQIDAAERALILGSLQQAGFDPEANDWMQNEMANPASIEDLVQSVGGSAELGSQVYTAARLAIHPDQRAEMKFLRMLAASLELPEDVVAQIDASTNAAQASA